MRIILKTAALVIATWFTFITLPIKLFATDYTVETRLATNVRKLPGIKHPVVVRVPAKSRLRVLARNASTDITGKKSWLKVESTDGKVGWIGTWLVKFVKSASDSMAPLMGNDMPNSLDSGAAMPPPSTMSAPSDSMAPAPSDSMAPTPSDSMAKPPEGGAMENIPDIEILDSVNESDLAK